MNLTEIVGTFEFDWMAYIQSQGFFVRQSIPVVSDGNVEDATDIDIWATKFLPPMRRSTAIVDCKNKTRSKPYERILWAKGLASYANADQIFVGLPKPTWKAIDFGNSGGVSVIPYETIKQHLAALPTHRRPYGQACHSLYGDFFPKRKAAIKADKQWSSKLFEARSYYRIGSPFTNINRIVESLRFSHRILDRSAGDSTRWSLWMFTCCELIAAFAMNLMRVAEVSLFLTPADRRGLLFKKLTYGDMPPDKAEDIIRLSSGLAYEYAKETIPLEHRSKMPLALSDHVRLPPPDYATDVSEILERITRNPMGYWAAFQMLDAMLFGNVVFQQPFQKGDLPRPDGSIDPAEAFKAAKNLIVLVCEAAGIPRQAFWPEPSLAGTQFADTESKSSGVESQASTPKLDALIALGDVTEANSSKHNETPLQPLLPQNPATQ